MASLAVILARGSSKRLPRKNVRPLNGVPLVAYCCAALRASRVDRAIVSTEDAEIARVCRAAGVEAPFVRPAALAEDYASSVDILGHAHKWMERETGQRFDIVVLVQPTTPFVEPQHIDACLAALEDSALACSFTARAVDDPPQWMFTQRNGRAAPLLGRAIEGDQEHSQHLAACYIPNGAAYAVRIDAMRAQNRVICDPAQMVIMSPERSVDVDDELDWLYAEMIARRFQFAPAMASEKAQ